MEPSSSTASASSDFVEETSKGAPPEPRPRWNRWRAARLVMELVASQFPAASREVPRTPELLATLMMLVHRASSDGEIWHGSTQLAEWVGTTSHTLDKSLRALERAGYLERKPRGYRGRFHGTIVLRFGHVVEPYELARAERASGGKRQAAEKSTSLWLEIVPVVREAYVAARWARHGVRAYREPGEGCWLELAAFVGELAAELERPAELVARLALEAYCRCPGKRDGLLSVRHHPIDWWRDYQADMEAAARSALRARRAPDSMVRELAAEPAAPPPPSALAIARGLFGQSSTSMAG